MKILEKIIRTVIIISILVVSMNMLACTNKINLGKAIYLVPDRLVEIWIRDLRQIRSDDDLKYIYLYGERTFKYPGGLGGIIPGIDFAIINTWVTFLTIYGQVSFSDILYGTFNFGKIRQDLEIAGWGRDSYQGVEIWNKINERTIALFETGVIVFGSNDVVRSCIEVNNTTKKSISVMVEGITSRINGGFLTVIFYDRLNGYSYTKKDKDTVTVLKVTKLNTVEDAQRCSAEIQRNVLGKNIKIKADLNYILQSQDINLTETPSWL